MLVTFAYNRERARQYAERWAFGRNPLFEDYTGIGGDCTSFVSQAVLAGSCVMNFTPTYGWYYLSPTSRAPAWSGVEFFWNFMTQNTGAGPFGIPAVPGGLTVGDVIQLSSDGETYGHSVLVTGFAENTYLVAAHTNDAYDRPLNTYVYEAARFLHIEGVRMEAPVPDCFPNLFSGGEGNMA